MTWAPTGSWLRFGAPCIYHLATGSEWPSTAGCLARGVLGQDVTRSRGTFNAPEFGDRRIGDGFKKHSYPFGLVVNADGKRFLDEGADFPNYTYAKYGREILRQPGQRAWQIFDAKVTHLLRDEYRIREVTRFRSDSLEGLAKSISEIDAGAFVRTVEEYNAAVQTDATFNPNIRDGRSTIGLDTPKSNWANTIDVPVAEVGHAP